MKQRFMTYLNTIQRYAAHPKFRVGVLLLFIVQAVFLVATMHPGVPPDETNHRGFIEFYAHHSLSPIFTEQTPTWGLGDKTRELDYLYHYMMSFVARLVPGESGDLYVIRLLTVVTAVVTFLLLIRVWRRLGVGPATINTSLLVLTNIPMVLMLSAAVNNDVIVWLFAVLGILLLLRLSETPRLLDGVMLLNILVLAGMMKRTLLPVAVALAAWLLVIIVKHRHAFLQAVGQRAAWRDWRVIVGLIVLVAGSGLLIERAGGNMLRYHSLAPSCAAVQGAVPCEAFWGAQRQKAIDLLIQKGDDSELKQWLNNTTRDEPPMIAPVFAVMWIWSSMYNTVDIQTQGWAHQVQPPYWLVAALSVLLFGLIVLGAAGDISRRKTSRRARQRLAIMAVCGVIIVAQLMVNYLEYINEHRIFGVALNGRYLLPALIFMIGISAFYATRSFKRSGQILIGIAVVGAVIVGSGLILMVRNAQLFTG